MIHGPNIPGSYAILLFTALDSTSIVSHIHNWALLLFWLCRFTLSGVISPLKLEVVKQEMVRMNIDLLGISELKWTEMGKFNSDDHYISITVGKNSIEETE